MSMKTYEWSQQPLVGDLFKTLGYIIEGPWWDITTTDPNVKVNYRLVVIEDRHWGPGFRTMRFRGEFDTVRAQMMRHALWVNAAEEDS